MKEHTSKSRRNFIKLSSLVSCAVISSPLLAGESLQLNNNLNPEVERFIEACKKGELEEVKNLISNNMSLLMAKDGNGMSGFSIALVNNHIEIGDYLKKIGYKTDLHESVLDKDWERYNELYGEENEESTKLINTDHPMGGTGMWAAAAAGAGQSIWRVYGGNCNPNIQSERANSTSPLQKALEYSDLKIAEMTAASLLSNNTDPNPIINGSPPPLHIAAQRGSTELVEMLIRLGAEIKTKDHRGRTAIQLAEYYGQKKTYDLLEQHQRINRTCRTSRYAYNISAGNYQRPDMSKIPSFLQGNLVGTAHGNIDNVKKLVGQTPQLAHSLATTSESGIEAGAHMGRKDIVEFLLESGAPYSLPTAVLMRDFTTVKKLLAEDSNRIHERGAHDFALLWYTIIGDGNLEMAQLLIDHGAKVEEQHFLGTTALHWACFRGPIELVELFIENGANVNRIGRKFTADGESPLQSTKDEKIMNLLKSKGAK